MLDHITSKVSFQESLFIVWKVTKLPGVQTGSCVPAAPPPSRPTGLNVMQSLSQGPLPFIPFSPINSPFILWPSSS